MQRTKIKLLATSAITLLFSIAILWHFFVVRSRGQAALLLKDRINLLEKTVEEKMQQQPQTKVVETVVSKCQPWGELQKEVHNCVARVSVYYAEFDWLQPFKTPRQKEGVGSGFFINEEGDFITNAHVVDEAYSIGIQIPSMGQEIFDAQVKGVSFDRDLALVQLSDQAKERLRSQLGKIPYLQFGDSDIIRRADEIMALGYPLGQEGLKSTIGVVSGKELDKIQIDAAINPGSSGGPVLNVDGKVIGISCSGILSAQNVGYIIPIDELKLIIDDLYKVRFLRRPFLGIISYPASSELTEFLKNPEPGGCYVADVFKGSPLHKAGVQAGDMIYQMNGYDIDLYGKMKVPWSEDRITLIDFGGRLKVGEPILMVVYRNGERKEFKATFDHMELPPVRIMHPGYDDIDYEIIGGMVIMELTRNHLPLLIGDSMTHMKTALLKYEDPKNQFEPTLIITHLFPGSQACRSRAIFPGMILKEVNGLCVKNLKEFRDSVQKEKNRGFLTIKTTDNILVALKIASIIEDEPRLSKDYRYPLTTLTRDLIEREKGGPISSFFKRAAN